MRPHVYLLSCLVARLVRGKRDIVLRRGGAQAGCLCSQPALWHSLIGGWRWCECCIAACMYVAAPKAGCWWGSSVV
jgi:hypothetical protein